MATRERTSKAIKSEAHMRRVSWTLMQRTFVFRQRALALCQQPTLVALVRAGAKFEKGLLAERPDEAGMKVAA